MRETDLIIITTSPFPIGMAATNRLQSYAEEISKIKKTTVIITKPTEVRNNIINKKTKGYLGSIYYEYVHKDNVWPKEKSKIYKLFILVSSLLLTIRIIKRYNPKTILMAGIGGSIYSLILRFIIQKWARINKIEVYQEMSEYLSFKKIPYIFKKTYIKLYRKLDGMLVMTKELTLYFEGIGQKKLYHLPMSVNFDRFDKNEIIKERNMKFTFKYCGGGNLERDGVKMMVETFIAMNEKCKNFVLHIIGPIDRESDYLKSILNTIKNNNAYNYIKFIGRKNKDEIPKLLNEADCLIMTPVKDFDSGGFPTKLGEYLATGKPVICTNVSEIPFYLNDSSAILIPPNDKKALKHALLDLINNYNKYKEIGENGRKVAKQNFTINAHVNGLINFLKLD